MAENLVEQLLDLMPELKEGSPWHSVGQRRSLDAGQHQQNDPRPQVIDGDPSEAVRDRHQGKRQQHERQHRDHTAQQFLQHDLPR